LLRDRIAELDCCIQTLWEAHGKFVQHFVQAKKEAEEVSASDFSFDEETSKVKCPEFWYIVKAAVGRLR
jgi:hypothetical protein